jgi:hypothetical protein
MKAYEDKARDAARQALQDCTVVRVTLGKVPLGYRLLQRDGEAMALRVPGQPDKADVRFRKGTDG